MKSGVRRPQTARDCTWPFRSVVRGGGVGGSLSGRTGHVTRPAGNTVSDIVTPLTALEIVWFIYFGVKFFYDPDDWDQPNWRTTSSTTQTLKSQNHFHLCPIGTSPEAQTYPETRADMGRSRRPLVTRGEFYYSAV